MPPRDEVSSYTELVRIVGWRKDLVDALGEELQQCLRWIHDGSADGLATVLASMRRHGISRDVLQGVSIYWHVLDGAEWLVAAPTREQWEATR